MKQVMKQAMKPGMKQGLKWLIGTLMLSGVAATQLASAQTGDTASRFWQASLAAEAKGALDEAQTQVYAYSNAGGDRYLAALRSGWLAFGRRDYEKALRFYKAAVEVSPQALTPRLGQMYAARYAGRVTEAIAAGDSVLAIQPGHREATLSRAASETVVLAIQDTTSLNYTTHQATEGLGPIASTGADATRGLEVHSLLVANLAGTPLGLLDVQAWARDPKTNGQSEERSERPTKAKESQKWLRGYAVADDAAKRLERTQVVVVGDREADIFDLFRTAAAGRAQLLVRATHPRRILTPEGKVEGHLWDCVRQEPVAGVMVQQ